MVVMVKRLEDRETPCEAQRTDPSAKATPAPGKPETNGRDEYRHREGETGRRLVENTGRGRAEYTGRH
ncbi:hypothetical protein [Pseudomonas sp. RIT-PI-S]|uniref:hypothetical protein n=1 Tax=Pseudomonas sp. RIT-PI-S TaxID=3035295 RepID=UPI0021D9F9F6|nr:hypothetical protein [Pseudomonas sp. RIT-PI-S]